MMGGWAKTSSEASITTPYEGTFVFLVPKPQDMRLSEVGLFRREGPLVVAAREASMNDSPNVSELLKGTEVNQRYYSTEPDIEPRNSQGP